MNANRRRLVVVTALVWGGLTAQACTSTPEAGQKPPPKSVAQPAAAEPEAAVAEGSADAAFQEAAARIYRSMLESRPQHAVELGYHDLDGKTPNFSKDALARDREDAIKARAELSAFDPSALTALRRVEREVLLGVIDQGLFQLDEMRAPQRNPLLYSLEVSTYISRPYAPVQDRARAVISVGKAAPAFFEVAQQNLDEKLPKTWVQIALLMTRGTADFVRKDVPAALGDVGDAALQTELDAAIQTFGAALDGHAKFLEGRLEQADDSFALGEARFLRMLEVTNGLKTDLTTLTKVAEADLAANLTAMDEAARRIDPNASTAEVVARVLADKPAKDKVLAEATQQCDELRKHLDAVPLVTIPSTDVAVVKETPPFLRFNFAFLDGAGPFEKAQLESFYYITPPDPAWPEAKQNAYVPGKTDLLGTSIHEVWPGHFLHALHRKQVDSAILKSFWNYAMGEGWAHYVEEMMITDGGYRSDEPEVRVGQLVNALLRDVRFVSAIGLHTGSMTVEESQKMFIEKAFQDEGNAQQQAVRGTFDPMYLSYTVGKLMIKKLKVDHKKAHPEGWTQKQFHDELLSFGVAPLPSIRREMLGKDAGPAL